MKKLAEMNRAELRAEAARLGIAGRGTMLKPELVAAIRKATTPAKGLPLGPMDRIANYDRQNGPGRELTPRQMRRIKRKGHTLKKRLDMAGVR